MTYLVSVKRAEDSDDFIITVYNTVLGAHLRTAVNLKKYDCEYSQAIGNAIKWAVGILEKEANRLIRLEQLNVKE